MCLLACSQPTVHGAPHSFGIILALTVAQELALHHGRADDEHETHRRGGKCAGVRGLQMMSHRLPLVVREWTLDPRIIVVLVLLILRR